MRHTEILERGERADGRGDQVIRDEQKRADDGKNFRAMTHARVNAAAIRVKMANDHVVDPDERREHAHRGDQPKRCVPRDCERQPDDIGFARPPVPVQNRGRARNVDVARSLNVGCDQMVTRTRRTLARRGASILESIPRSPCPLMTLTRLAVGLEPLNALDAAHRSPRSIPAVAGLEFGSPAGPAPAEPLSRTKNWQDIPASCSTGQAGCFPGEVYFLDAVALTSQYSRPNGGITMLHLDTGNTAFMLLCASLVMLMTPGLAFFYGGLVGRKNVLAIMMQSFVSMGWTTVLWWAFGFSMCFSGDQKSGTDFFGIIGNFDWAGLRGITLATPSPSNDTIPMVVFCAYQMMFAIITPALITGAFTNRITFKAYMLFLTAWLILVYFPFVHMVWGGGLLAEWGVKDFAGGIVVHNIAGIAALASILYVGKRKVVDRGPHSIPLVALGTGLLWFGWYGFNAGSEFRVDSTTAVAFINTDIAASFAAIAWLLVDWRVSKKPKFLGLLTGAVAGLATITPAAGYVSPATAVIIGTVAGVVCYYACALKNKLRWDDALDVWGVHGVGGFLGIILLGVFASTAWNPAANGGVNGLLAGDSSFFLKQLAAGLFSSVWAFGFTLGMLWLIDRITPVRVEDAHEELGLDEAIHGETAYVEVDVAVVRPIQPL